MTFGLSAVSLAVSAAGVWYSIRLAHRMGVMDVPNERSSHAVPTPRMGGIPMVAAAALTFGFWAFWAAGGMLFAKGLSQAMIFALSMSILGFWDDVSDLSPLLRFLVQIVASALFLWACSFFIPRAVVGGWIVPTTAWILTGAVWIVWILNLYNFMDGIDGLAGGEAAMAASFFFLVFAHYGESGWAVANLLIAAASLGFLVHNWPPARVFMGDAGSAFLGGFFGFQSIIAAMTTPVPSLVLVLPFANFILDTTVTLIRRMLRKEKWYQAHRSHFYQRMTQLGISHRKVTVLELFGVAGSCAAAAACLRLGSVGRAAVVSAVLVIFAASGIWVHRKEHELRKGEIYQP